MIAINAPKIKNVGFVLLSLVVAYIASAFLAGVFTALGGNIEFAGLTGISFDPLITIAYLILYHYLSFFFKLTRKISFSFFLFALFLSFTLNFIQGAILLILLLFFLEKAKVLEKPQQHTESTTSIRSTG
jgi:hypothetical protein